MGMRSVLYEFQWQKVRVSCLRKYNFKGGWTTKAGVEQNLDTLTRYLDEGEKLGSLEESVRIYRVINLLNATRMGYNGQRAGGAKDLIDALDEEVVEFRDAVRDGWEYNRQAVVDVGLNWSWLEVEVGIRKGIESDPGWFDAIYEDLMRRESMASKKIDTKLTRNELTQFMTIMDKVKLEAK